jgi:hypothetical protein
VNRAQHGKSEEQASHTHYSNAVAPQTLLTLPNHTTPVFTLHALNISSLFGAGDTPNGVSKQRCPEGRPLRWAIEAQKGSWLCVLHHFLRNAIHRYAIRRIEAINDEHKLTTNEIQPNEFKPVDRNKSVFVNFS